MQPSTSKTLKTDTFQLTLQQSIDKTKLWDINNGGSKRKSFLIGEMIAVDMHPFSIVEDILFQRLMKDACPNYKLLSRKYFCDSFTRYI